MIRFRWAAATLFLAGLAAALFAPPLVADPPAPGSLKEGKDLLPNRKHQSLKGNVVGILLVDGQPCLSAEGRTGPPDQVCFATAACSYRWVYVPVADGARIASLQVPVGEKPGMTQLYPSLDLARLTNLKGYGIAAGYTLVEVEVNNRQGSPPGDSFVATNARVLEGTKEYPLKTADVVKQMQQKFADYLKDNGKAIDEAMDKAAQNALKKDQQPTGPREKSEVMYVTWMPDTETVRVHFKVRISDGSYTYVEGGIGPGKKGMPQPPPPPPGKQPQPPPPPPPPPPPKFKTRVGTTFGVEFGVAYEIDKTGKLVHTEVVPFQSFTLQLPPPPGAGPNGQPVPLPVVDKK
jgi:hypothetical protein